MNRALRALEGAFNFRDLGGLEVSDGRRVRAGRLMRSDTLQALTDADASLLVDRWGLRTVVDLRLTHEVIEEGRGPLATIPRVRFVHSPLGMASTDGLAPDQVLVTLYERCLASDSLPQAISAIAEHADSPTLFHCAAGKDRTGIVAAMVLGLIGVGTDSIVADYMRSEAAMPRIIDRFMSWPRYRDHLSAMPPEVYAVEERPIRHLLGLVQTEFGGPRHWAARNGIPPSAVKRLEDHLVGAD